MSKAVLLDNIILNMDENKQFVLSILVKEEQKLTIEALFHYNKCDFVDIDNKNTCE